MPRILLVARPAAALAARLRPAIARLFGHSDYRGRVTNDGSVPSSNSQERRERTCLLAHSLCHANPTIPRVAHIFPRSVVREQQNVFVVSTILDALRKVDPAPARLLTLLRRELH